MKLTNIKKTVEKMDTLRENCRAAKFTLEKDPTNVTLKRNYAMAKARFSRALNTLKNYSPIFTVKLGQLEDCAKEVYASMGQKCELYCYSLRTDCCDNAHASLFLKIGEGENRKTQFLATLDMTSLDQPLRDVEINTLKNGMLKGFYSALSKKSVAEELNIIAWNAITKTILANIEEKKIAKAIKEEEKGIN